MKYKLRRFFERLVCKIIDHDWNYCALIDHDTGEFHPACNRCGKVM